MPDDVDLHSGYDVLGRVGEGSAGVVYRARDRTSGEVVALKVMPRRARAPRLRGEFLALRSLRHPNIVAVRDYGLTRRGDDFFTMDYVEGPRLEEAVGAVPSDRFFFLAGGALEALAFIHRRGVVHADIKPSNILVDARALRDAPERASRLVDFGLSAALGDPAASAPRGTFPYAAPEVYAGELDARSDLYAVGVVLYELAAKTAPFEGENLAEVLAAQRSHPPADPRAYNPELPDGLAELILALLEPSPGARPQTAEESLARINELAGTNFAIADASPLVAAGGTLVGRETELGILRELWDRAARGEGSAALVHGEEGMGKSRLLAEFSLEIQLEGGRVYSADASSAHAGPHAGFSQLARSLLGSLGDRADDLHRAYERALSPLFGEATQPSEISAESRYAVAEALASILLEAAAREPIAVLVENADAADPTVAELLAYLLRAAGSAPVVLIAAARSGQGRANARGDAGATPGPAGLIEAAAAMEHARAIALAPLDRENISRLTGDTFGDHVARAIAGDLHRACGGNPGHARRALELLVERGELRRHRGAWILADGRIAIPFPESALGAARARLEQLGADARRILEAAAVAGASFTGEIAAAIVAPELGESAGDEVIGALAEAAKHRVIQADASAGRFQFLHPELADDIAASLPADRKRRYHARAAEALERARARGDAVSAENLANHFDALGARERAAAWGWAAAEERAGAYDHHGAIAWFRRALDASEADPGAARIRERLADVLATVGEAEKARAHYREVADAPGLEASERIRALRGAADVERQLGEGEVAYETLMRALAEARHHRLGEEEARVHHAVGRVLMYRAEYNQALQHATAGHVLARHHGLSGLSALIQGLRSDIEIYRGEHRAALAHVDEGASDAEASGDESLLGAALSFAGRAAVHAGDYDRAIRALERAIPLNRRSGRVPFVARNLNNLGASYYFRGDWDRAQRAWEEFRDLCARLDERSELVTAYNNLGLLYRDQGAHTEALAALDRAADLAEATGHTYMAAMISGNRGDVSFRQGDLATARRRYEDSLEAFSRIGAPDFEVENKRRLCEVDAASGRITAALDRAVDAAREARDAGARLEEGILHRVAARALRLRGDLDSAAWFCQRAAEILADLPVRFERARLDVERGELALAGGDPEGAAGHLDAAVETFSALGARWDLAAARARRREIEPRDGERALGGRGGFALLFEIGRSAAHYPLDALLDRALDKLLELSGYDRGFILLLDDDGRPRERTRRTRPGSRSFARDDAAFSGSVVRRVAASGQAVSFTDIDREDELRHQQSVVALGLRRVMCAPLRAHGRVLGVVYIDSARVAPRESELDLSLLEAFAAQTALAVENARLREEERRKTELMGILAHEIRNPLGGILGYSELGAHGDPAATAAEETFSRISRDAQRLRRIVDNILELARHESGKVEWSMTGFDMAELIAEVTDNFRPHCAPRGIELVVDTEGLSARALGSPDRISQVLSNLLSNALKFSPDGDRITLRARRESVSSGDPESPPAPPSELHAWAPVDPEEEIRRDYVRVDVEDRGPGMTEDVRSRLFRKFSQGEETPRKGGVGLGLYISREIVHRHGGTIWVTSEPGSGAAFSFRIPIGE